MLQMRLSTKQKQTHRPREQTYGDEMGDAEMEKLGEMQTIMQKMDQQ